MPSEKELKSCELCSATIYPEHIHSGRAAYLDEKLLCPICLNEKKAESGSPLSAMDGEEGVSLIDENEMGQSGRKIIKSFGQSTTIHTDRVDFQRSLLNNGTGATRMRVYHTKMNDGAVDFMTNAINAWIDSHPDIEVKFVQSTVGVWEGKHPEPHLIVTIWY